MHLKRRSFCVKMFTKFSGGFLCIQISKNALKDDGLKIYFMFLLHYQIKLTFCQNGSLQFNIELLLKNATDTHTLSQNINIHSSVFIYTNNRLEYCQLFPIPICRRCPKASLYCTTVLRVFPSRIQS